MAGSVEGSKVKINMDDNSQWDVVGGALQRPTCGDDTFLSDSQGQDLQTNEGALRAMQAGERYSLAGYVLSCDITPALSASQLCQSCHG